MSALNPTGFDETKLPDFSPTGLPIVFGLYIRLDANAANDTKIGIDNWRIHVNFVPEPNAAMVAMPLVGLAALRRRR